MSLRATLSCVSIVALCGQGCASTQSLGRKAMGSPEEGGIAVIRVVMDADFALDPNTQAIFQEMQIGDVRLPQSAALEAVIRRLDAPALRDGRSFAGLILFSNLEPGVYALHALEHPRMLVEHIRSWNIVCDRREFKLAGQSPHVTFEVRAGSPTYVGALELQAHYEASVIPEQMTVELRGGSGSFAVRFVRDPDEEIRAWTSLLAAAPQSPWAALIAERVERLRGGTGR